MLDYTSCVRGRNIQLYLRTLESVFSLWRWDLKDGSHCTLRQVPFASPQVIA